MDLQQTELRFYSFCISDVEFRIRNDYNYIQKISPKYETGFHSHHTNELHCFLSGTETVSVISRTSGKEKDYVVSENEVILIPHHSFHRCASNNTCSYVNITIDIQKLKTEQSLSKNSLYSIVQKRLSINDEPIIFHNDELTALLDKIRAQCAATNSNYFFCNTHQYQVLMARIILNMVDELIKNEDTNYRHNGEMTERDREFIIRDFICQSYRTPNALTLLSERLHLSERQTQTVVEHLMGKNFKTLILEQKMTLAKFLIENTQYSLSKVAESVGYASYSSFFTAYRNYFGHAPNEKRKSDPEPETP